MPREVISTFSNTLFYRPVWSCVHRNVANRVALVYNLIAGYSFFYEGEPADLADLILSTEDNGEVSVEDIASEIGYDPFHVALFCQKLHSRGVLSPEIPTPAGIAQYRQKLADLGYDPFRGDIKMTAVSRADFSDAERVYFGCVENDDAVSTVLFEVPDSSRNRFRCFLNPHLWDAEQKSKRMETYSIDLFEQVLNRLMAQGVVRVFFSCGHRLQEPRVMEMIHLLHRSQLVFDVLVDVSCPVDSLSRLKQFYPFHVNKLYVKGRRY